MINNNLKDIAEKLNQLACKECTKGWISKHDKYTDPLDDIMQCFEMGFITSNLKERLVKEVKEIKEQI
tara:strand:+ start:160 stop:363 length:204 start_codon:yes stop_codon:yes gene_type:complete